MPALSPDRRHRGRGEGRLPRLRPLGLPLPPGVSSTISRNEKIERQTFPHSVLQMLAVRLPTVLHLRPPRRQSLLS